MDFCALAQFFVFLCKLEIFSCLVGKGIVETCKWNWLDKRFDQHLALACLGGCLWHSIDVDLIAVEIFKGQVRKNWVPAKSMSELAVFVALIIPHRIILVTSIFDTLILLKEFLYVDFVSICLMKPVTTFNTASS